MSTNALAAARAPWAAGGTRASSFRGYSSSPPSSPRKPGSSDQSSSSTSIAVPSSPSVTATVVADLDPLRAGSRRRPGSPRRRRRPSGATVSEEPSAASAVTVPSTSSTQSAVLGAVRPSSLCPVNAQLVGDQPTAAPRSRRRRRRTRRRRQPRTACPGRSKRRPLPSSARIAKVPSPSSSMTTPLACSSPSPILGRRRDGSDRDRDVALRVRRELVTSSVCPGASPWKSAERAR